MARGKRNSFSIGEFMEKKFDPIQLAPDWMALLGEDLVKRFDVCVTGDSANGKTTFVLQLVKELSKIGYVFYNSYEQGLSASLQTNIKLVDLTTCKGKVFFGNKLSFEDLKKKFQNKYFRCNYLVIDSQDWMNFTEEQYRELQSMKPKTLSIITICWAKPGIATPRNTHAQAIHYAADCKIHVQDFVAYCRGRFGASKPFVIWEEGHLNAMKKKEKRSKVIKQPKLPLNDEFSNLPKTGTDGK